MKIELHEIRVRELCAGYNDLSEGGRDLFHPGRFENR